MELLSVLIITYNEEENIGRCIDSVKTVADEIIVLDSFSTDKTIAIALEKGAIVHQSAFAGYVAQKNKALLLANNNYILSLDADEALDEVAVQSIIKAKQSFIWKAYKINRCAYYCGKFIRYGAWYPEPKIRLFDKRAASWGGADPHDQVQMVQGTAVFHLKGDILHYICNSVAEHKKRSENFSSIAATSLFNAGKKTNWLKILSSPAWFFLNDYFIRKGFLNGKQGWAIAINQARYHYLKYKKLYQLQKNKKGLSPLQKQPL